MTKGLVQIPLSRMSDDTVKPTEYLHFASRDIIEDDSRANVNALSNIKRAIDSQLDVILESYGLLNKSIKKSWPFPKKIEIVKKIGVVAPHIIKVINKNRVQMEHYHNAPPKEDVVEFLGIAELFIERFKSLKTRTEVLIDYENDFAVWMDIQENKIHVFDNTKQILKCGGVSLFCENIKHNVLHPIQTIPISDIESWTAACARYFRYK